MFGQEILLFDGAMGTELYDRGFYINRPFEELNLSAPSDVVAVHDAYIQAGAQVITTNTFSIAKTQLRQFDIENQQAALIQAALRNANQARQGTAIKVGFSTGPLGVLVEPLGSFGLEDARAEFKTIAETAALYGQFDLYILETFSNVSELVSAIQGIREVDVERPILASLSVKSTQNEMLEQFAQKVGGRKDVQALGLNCSEGPSDLFSALKKLIPLTEKPIIAQPNAGVPRQVNGRYFYMTSPDYIAKYAKRYIEAGAQGVGGCCGTGPSHIRAIRNAVRMMNAKRTQNGPKKWINQITDPKIHPNGTEENRGNPLVPFSDRPASHVGKLLQQGKKILSVEMLPPKGTDIEKFLEGVEKLRQSGVDFVNIPDGARASTRVGSLHLAALVHQQFKRQIHALPHFTTRDRNLIALQSDLLGAYINGVTDLLLITGDPPKLGNNKDATAVFDIDAIGLTYLASCLNRGQSPTGESLGRGTQYGIGVAANPTAVNPEQELRRWRYKVDSGADFAVTQPIFHAEAFLRWKEALGTAYRPQIVGVWPLVSLRNAEFMANEVPGVYVPPWVLEEMSKAGEDRDEATRRGLDIAQKVMQRLENECEGFCISAPLGKIEVALQLLPGPRQR